MTTTEGMRPARPEQAVRRIDDGGPRRKQLRPYSDGGEGATMQTCNTLLLVDDMISVLLAATIWGRFSRSALY